MITISAFQWVPDFAQGQVRDLRARWALEEAGLPYQSRLLAMGDQDKPEYRATQWLIAALNSIEPWIMQVALIDLSYPNEEWAKARRPGALEFAHKRLSGLSNALGDKAFLDGDRFTAGDLMMATVLRILESETAKHANLAAYLKRCTARPAFQRALAAQMGDFKAAA